MALDSRYPQQLDKYLTAEHKYQLPWEPTTLMFRDYNL